MTAAEKTAEKPYHHGDLRRKLVDVIRELIETDGPDGFSVAEAARRAGVSSAAPYKHFRDRSEILHAVTADAMDRLAEDMRRACARHPAGSLEAIAGIGQAYVAFARNEPGVFRVMFGLSEDHDDDPALLEKGADSYGILNGAVARYLGVPVADASVALKSYALWTLVHGYAFLEIDGKSRKFDKQIGEWEFLLSIGGGILAAPPVGADAAHPA